jgi:Mrp family chromosome partitioning ATPase
VIEQGMVSSRAIADTKEQLENSGVRILGAVLNKVHMEASHYGKYYGRYYGKYYGRYYGKYYGHYGQKEEK